MADNFRNKQWFKKMSQERKDEICKKFDINEKTLKKACRETDDERIVINLLKIDNLLHNPESWSEYNKVISNNSISKCDGSFDEQLENIKNIYSLFNNVTFLKYKKSKRNDLLVNQAIKYINYWIDEYYNKETDKEYCAYQIYTHINTLLVTDINIIKQ